MNASYADAPDQPDNVNEYLARLAKKDFSSADSLLVEPLPAGTPADYRIAGKPGPACHAADQEPTASKHAHPFETIKAKNFHVDSYCQSCHTTGYGLPGGFDRLSTGSGRLGVGCESCHGPSAAHVHDPKKHTPFAAADQCSRCHDHATVRVSITQPIGRACPWKAHGEVDNEKVQPRSARFASPLPMAGGNFASQPVCQSIFRRR